MAYQLAPRKQTITSDPTTWLNVQPAWMTDGHRDTSDWIGWHAITEHDDGKCWVVGYMVIIPDAIRYFDNDGVCYRESSLHKVTR